MQEVGEFSRALPIRRAGVGAKVDWDSHALRAREQPGEPLLVATNMRESLVKSARQRHRPPWIDSTGRIIVNARNGRRDENGVLFSDVYLTWTPYEQEG